MNRFSTSVIAALYVGRTQIGTSLRRIDDLMPLLTMPLYVVVPLAVLDEAGRPDLAAYAICSSTLMTTVQMSLFVGGDILANDRRDQTIELHAIAPVSYAVVVFAKVMALSCLSILGLIASCFVSYIGFGYIVHVRSYMMLALVASSIAFSSASFAFLMTSIIAKVRSPRVLQNVIGSPLFLLGGILVPVKYLPAVFQAAAPANFLYWAAMSLRSVLSATAPDENSMLSIAILVLFGLTMLSMGYALLNYMLDRLRTSGELGFA